MPIYEFVCESCEHEFEKIVSFSAATAPACPACNSDDVKRRMSKPAIHFKGSGWYITDSKSDGKKNGTGTNGSGEKTKDTVTSTGASNDSAKSESPKGDSVKTESVKSESATPSAVKAES